MRAWVRRPPGHAGWLCCGMFRSHVTVGGVSVVTAGSFTAGRQIWPSRGPVGAAAFGVHLGSQLVSHGLRPSGQMMGVCSAVAASQPGHHHGRHQEGRRDPQPIKGRHRRRRRGRKWAALQAQPFSAVVGSDVVRYKLVVQFSGPHFSGWQRQESASALRGPATIGNRKWTVQGALEEAVFRFSQGLPLRVYGAGRTDAGVHALGQVCHVDIPRSLHDRLNEGGGFGSVGGERRGRPINATAAELQKEENSQQQPRRSLFFRHSVHTFGDIRDWSALAPSADADDLDLLGLQRAGVNLARALNFNMPQDECQILAAFPIVGFRTGFSSLRHDSIPADALQSSFGQQVAAGTQHPFLQEQEPLPLPPEPSSAADVRGQLNPQPNLWKHLTWTAEEKWADSVFHARHSAVQRHYVYRICLAPSGGVSRALWEEDRAWCMGPGTFNPMEPLAGGAFHLDLGAMQQAAELMSAEPYDWLCLVNSPRGHHERERYRNWMRLRFDEVLSMADAEQQHNSTPTPASPEGTPIGDDPSPLSSTPVLPLKRLRVSIVAEPSTEQSLLRSVHGQIHPRQQVHLPRQSSATGPELLQVHVSGVSFLYKQVCNMVGALVAVGRGRLSLDRLAEALRQTDRDYLPEGALAKAFGDDVNGGRGCSSEAVPMRRQTHVPLAGAGAKAFLGYRRELLQDVVPAPPHGLYLSHVEYAEGP